MSSAATVAENVAASQASETTTQTPVKGSLPAPPAVKVDTSSALYDNGRVYLHGNPLKTIPEILCPQCKLPRLLYPISGVGSQLPDLNKQYCNRHPFISRPGHDIYGNPFPAEQAKSKKERELQKRAEKDAARAGTPGSQDSGPGGDNNNGVTKLAPGGKPASYVPWHTCPNCKRSLLITRFAQHLEKCLGISGRQSSRNAMAKLSGQSGTPIGSRVGTPAPGSHGGSKKEEDDEEDAIKKVKKKSSYIKKTDRGLLPRPKGRPPKSVATVGDGEREDGKRGRDEGEADVPRKKIRLFKEQSTVSEAASQEDGTAGYEPEAAASPGSGDAD